jgi:NAD+ synthase (glutamine-hydrolysing)
VIISMAQLNPVVGDLVGNIEKVKHTVAECHLRGSDLVVFPELFLVGYPPKDLLEKAWFIDKCQEAMEILKKVSAQYPQTGFIVGAPLLTEEPFGKGLYNGAVLFFRGEIISRHYKSLLPTYDVFDESRYFNPAPLVETVSFKGETLGISICEDAWNEPELWKNKNVYSQDPIAELAHLKATLLINIAASPFHIGKETVRYTLVRGHAQKHKLPFVYVNQVGGNDELIFDGGSLAVDKEGVPLTVCPSFQEHIETFETTQSGKAGLFIPQDKVASVSRALVLGIKDYMDKCGFKSAIIGLSGGIDSALTCCLATEAVGKEHVLGITMPSPYSSQGSIEDSLKLANHLGIDCKVIPISHIYESYLSTLAKPFAGTEPNEAEENIQARIRGNILMAFSNKYGSLVLSTGNKSEMSVGYCTLYGDMSGGLSVLADVPKSMVYQIARHVNRDGEIIPWSTITKPPSAELKPNQIDQDTLPPYDVLDEILQYYIEEGYSEDELLSLNKFPADTVKWVIKSVIKNEYKRTQAAPGLKVTPKAFGTGRRMPIAAKHRYP